MYRLLKYKPGTKRLLRPIIKFNGGRGAIICHKCRKIIKENIRFKEWFGNAEELFCAECAKEMIMELFHIKKIKL
jgi:DNA-directed RNA polymerase beta' subunit